LRRRLFVLVDRDGRPVEAAGPAPFDGRTREEAEREARATVREFRPDWRLVPISRRLRKSLRAMAATWGVGE
jgi:hypothetical protein